MKFGEFMAALDVLPSNVKLDPKIRITAYTAALAGEGITGGELDEVLRYGLQRWRFYPSPSEILDAVSMVRENRYRAILADCIAIDMGENRVRLVARNSPEGQAEIKRLESESAIALPDGDAQKSRFRAALARLSETIIGGKF